VDRRGAARAARRRHVEEPFDAVQLLLDDLRDVRLEHGRVGARIRHLDRQRRRCDRRVLLDRQRAQREEPGEKDRERDDPREYRAVDEVARDHGAAGSGPASDASARESTAATSSTGSTSTRCPGCTRCSPSTITRSPASRPASTAHRPSRISPSSTGRDTASLSGPTTITLAPCSEKSTARCGISVTSGRTPTTTRARTNWPGRSNQSGFGNSARSAAVPVSTSNDRSRKSTRPSCSYTLPSSRTSV